MSILMRAHDWSQSSLGDPTAWPGALQSAVRIMLSSGHPMSIWWGTAGVCLFNDALFLAIGESYLLDGLGLPASNYWGETWPVLQPQADQVMAGHGATWSRDRLLPLTRRGALQDTYWSYSFSPIEDASAANGVGGVLFISVETTERVLAERSLAGEIKSQQQHYLAAPGFIAILRGPTHIFDFINPAYRRLMGERDFIGRPVIEVAPEVEDQGFIRILDRVYRTGERFISPRRSIMLRRGTTANLEQRVLNFVYEPIIEKDRSVSGIFVEGFDITDLEDSERQLAGPVRKPARETHERWTALF